MSHFNSIRKIIIPEDRAVNSQGVYLDWSPNNIRSLIIFDDVVLVRYYGPTKHNQYNLIKYSIEAPYENSNEWESVINLLFWEIHTDDINKGHWERLNGLEDFAVFSKNRSLLEFELDKYRNDYSLSSFSFPCLHNVGFYYIEQDFDVDEAIDDMMRFFSASRYITEESFVDFCKGIKCEEIFATEGNEFSWYKNPPGDGNRVLNPDWYALDANNGCIAAVLKMVCSYSDSGSEMQMRMEKRLNADMIKYDLQLKQLNDMAAKWKSTVSDILKHRLGMEQALAYGYCKLSKEKSVRTDLNKRFILNHYYNGTISQKINGSDMFVKDLKKEITDKDYTYIRELAKRSGNKDLFAVVNELSCIAKYICDDYYEWEYLTPNVAFNYSETKDLSLEDYSEMVWDKLKSNYSNSNYSYNNLTDLIAALDNTKEYYRSIPDEEPNSEMIIDFLLKLMRIVIEEELISCCKMYFEVLPLWETNGNELSDDMAAIAEEIKNGTDIDFTSPKLYIDDFEEKILDDLIMDPSKSHAAIQRSYMKNMNRIHKRIAKRNYDEFDIVLHLNMKKHLGSINKRNFVLTNPEEAREANWGQIKIYEQINRAGIFNDYEQMGELICSLYRTLFKRFKVFDERMPEVLKVDESMDAINTEDKLWDEIDKAF